MARPEATPRQLLDALGTLRVARDRSARRYQPEWRLVMRFLDETFRARDHQPDHDEAVQHTLLKVLTKVDQMLATTPASAAAWVKRVYRRRRDELRRRRVRNAVDLGLASGDGFLERLRAPEPPRAGDVEALSELEEDLFDLVDAWLCEHVGRPGKRLGDRRRAEVAFLAAVRGLDHAEIEARLGADAPARATLYKWIERGREEVLLPALAWTGGPQIAPPVRRTLVQILEAERRSDAGRPRPRRRRRASVSPTDDCTSNQVPDDRQEQSRPRKRPRKGARTRG